MRRTVAAVIAFGLVSFGCSAVRAQSTMPTVISPNSNATPDGTAIAVPPAPPIMASPATPIAPSVAPPAEPPPPGLTQIAPPAANADNGSNETQAPANEPPATALDAVPEPPNTWLPGKVAKIGVLDKIDGSVSELSIPVGGQSTAGDLQINVAACVTRPPDQIPDTAIFVALQNTANLSAPPVYRGWLVRSTPGAAVAGDASETLRVISCS